MTTATASVERPRPEAIILMVFGAAIVVLGLGRAIAGSTSGMNITLIALGAGIFVIGAALERLKSLKIGPTGVAGELFERPAGRAVIEAAGKAPDSALSAVLPLLREDVSSDVVAVPTAQAGKRLIDPELAFVRQELNVTVFAIRRPGDVKWCGGGRVSTTVLPEGTQLAVAGEPADIAELRRRLAD